MIPLGQISSVVQTLSNIQGFNPGAFGQLSGTIQSALKGFDQASSLVQGFASGSPVQAFTSALGATGLAGSSISAIAGSAASAYRQADSFLSAVGQASSFSRLTSQRPGVEEVRARNQAGSGSLQFPRDIGKYWMAMQFEYASFDTISSIQLGSYSRKGSGDVFLPVPMNLTDVNALVYQPLSLTEKGKEALGGLIGGLAGASDVVQKLGRFGDALGGIFNAVSAVGEAGLALSGFAVNTHQTLKFVQPSLKSHAFSWKLVPSTKEESEILYNIIRFIKSKIYPTSDYGGLAFKYPHLINIILYNQDQMYIFKPAYVESFSVNYTTESGPAFHKDKYPVSVQIDMKITETVAWLSTDF
jgi:hypothetical protein